MRPEWRAYIGSVLPHAEQSVRSFMLTCMAEGRAEADDDETDRRKGPEVVCKLSLDDVHGAITLRERKDDDHEENATQKFVLRTAQLAARLSQLSTTSRPQRSPGDHFHISPMHREIPPQPQAEDGVEEVALAADVERRPW